MSRRELEAILDYILNKADEAEFQVIRKACERRGRDRGAFAALGGTSSQVMARNLAEGIQKQMGASRDEIRNMVRGFVADIVRKNAPEIDAAELETLLDSYLPDPAATSQPEPEEGLAAGMKSTIPAEALLDMARRFVEYSEGRMPPSKQQELWQEMPRWQEAYWNAFPPALKVLIKAYLDGKLDGDTFGTALLSILGL